MKRLLLLLAILTSFTGCTTLFLYWIKPGDDFDPQSVPVAPDYSRPEAWAALPDQTDEPDDVPTSTNLKDEQSQATADVFFVHPTTYLSSDGWNAPYDGSIVVYDLSPLKLQTSVFNGSARIYAPRYRQATLYSFAEDTENARQALALASSDVMRAFAYYLEHYNRGRPFFLAGHSQGSLMLIDVLKKYMDQRPMSNFVAAYLPGWAIIPAEFKNLKPCRTPDQIGCFVSWNSKKWGSVPEDFPIAATRYTNGLCVNPITWTINEQSAEPTSHKGGVNFAFREVDSHLVRAKCEGDMLWVDVSDEAGYSPRRGDKRNLHVADYSLFYIDIRENIALRLGQYWARRGR
ncbi:MAG: DUF3089 domain-containing protein [Leptospiraceae bacterium]|nr:DUF3089 domain-containing protein [Leptospiraceae bacterium]